ncbi:hypothetical protein OSB04_024420 [Centaurea solstitialis]|uniref:Uncharacterized protein n=1 Tax=Centaurea solstitialis TaxID=347529 RepID=A0AA38STK4_9ASTR|nr:hypothetical protein OSB04_024420 [Centaurea solstitialis]
MDVALSTTLANPTLAVNRLQPSSVNDYRRRRDRFEEPVMAPHNGIHNRIICSSSESKKEEEDDPQERIDVVLQRILLSSKEESQQHSLFRSHCSAHKKVCNLVIDSRSCENLVSRKLVDYFNLPTQPHESPYSIGWTESDPLVRVTHTCRIPISIGKHYQDEVLCEVLDMDVCHILLGGSWQHDNGVTYISRDNVVLFRWGDRKIAMRGLNSFDERPHKKEEVLPNKVDGEDLLAVKEICNEPKNSAMDYKPAIVTETRVPKPDLGQAIKKTASEPEKNIPIQVESMVQELKEDDSKDTPKIPLFESASQVRLLLQKFERVHPKHTSPAKSDEDVFQVNSRTSSFQVGMTDTGRFQARPRPKAKSP